MWASLLLHGDFASLLPIIGVVAIMIGLEISEGSYV
jgi:hypothetical protein